MEEYRIFIPCLAEDLTNALAKISEDSDTYEAVIRAESREEAVRKVTKKAILCIESNLEE
jgi:hypothetical protein